MRDGTLAKRVQNARPLPSPILSHVSSPLTLSPPPSAPSALSRGEKASMASSTVGRESAPKPPTFPPLPLRHHAASQGSEGGAVTFWPLGPTAGSHCRPLSCAEGLLRGEGGSLGLGVEGPSAEPPPLTPPPPPHLEPARLEEGQHDGAHLLEAGLRMWGEGGRWGSLCRGSGCRVMHRGGGVSQTHPHTRTCARSSQQSSLLTTTASWSMPRLRASCRGRGLAGGEGPRRGIAGRVSRSLLLAGYPTLPHTFSTPVHARVSGHHSALPRCPQSLRVHNNRGHSLDVV